MRNVCVAVLVAKAARKGQRWSTGAGGPECEVYSYAARPPLPPTSARLPPASFLPCCSLVPACLSIFSGDRRMWRRVGVLRPQVRTRVRVTARMPLLPLDGFRQRIAVPEGVGAGEGGSARVYARCVAARRRARYALCLPETYAMVPAQVCGAAPGKHVVDVLLRKRIPRME